MNIHILAHQSKVFLLGFRNRVQYHWPVTIDIVRPGIHALHLPFS